MIDLLKFCCDRPGLTQPWTDGEFTYACSGPMMVRVPRDSIAPPWPERPDAPTNVWSRIFRLGAYHEKVSQWQPPLVCRNPPDERCEICGGQGEHECQACGEMHNCKKCSGKGWVDGRASIEITGVHFHVRYLALMSTLPKIEIPFMAILLEPMPFRFEDGLGLLMPVHKSV